MSLLSEQNDYAGAEKMCQQSLVVYGQIGNRPDAATAHTNCGVALQNLGNLPAARQQFQEALEIYREVGNRDSEALGIHALGALLVDQGNLSEGQKMLEQARAFWKDTGNRRSLSYAIFNLGLVAEERGDLPVARQRYQEALSIRRDLGEQVGAAESEVSLAGLSVEQGHPEAGLASAREAAGIFRVNNSPDDEATAYLVVARALLLERKAAEALGAVRRAHGLSGGSQDFRMRLLIAIVESRAEAAVAGAGDHAAVARAVASLQSAAAEARRRGVPAIEFEARLALGEIEIESGDGGSGRPRLAALKRDAQAAGFGLVAAKAGKTLQSFRN